MDVRLGDLSRPLTALVALNIALMLAWTVVLPTFRGPDEHVQHDFLRYLTETWDYPDYDELHVHQRTLFAIVDSPVQDKDDPPGRQEQATPRGQRSSWSDLAPDVRSERPNQLAQHPPLYYVPTAALLRVIDGDGDRPLGRVVWELRLLSAAILAALPLVAADIAHRLGASPTVILSAAAAVLAVPQLTHLGAVVSNDPPMILLSSLSLAGATRLLTGDRRWSTAVATGILTGLALLTKGFAVPIVVAVAGACLLPLWPGSVGTAGRGEREPAGRTLGLTAAVGAVTLACGGWWWIRNVVVFGNPQPGVGLRPRVEDVELDVVRFAGQFSSRLIDSSWGNVGWREAQLPLVVSIVLTALLVAAVGVACRAEPRRLVLVAPTIVAGAMVLAAGWGAFRKTGVSHATQGRYLFPSVTVLAALAAIGIARIGGPWVRRHQARLVLGLAIALQAAMLLIAVRRYWAGDWPERIDALVAFSPLDPTATVALLLVPLPAAVAAALTMRRSADPPDVLDARSVTR